LKTTEKNTSDDPHIFSSSDSFIGVFKNKTMSQVPTKFNPDKIYRVGIKSKRTEVHEKLDLAYDNGIGGDAFIECAQKATREFRSKGGVFMEKDGTILSDDYVYSKKFSKMLMVTTQKRKFNIRRNKSNSISNPTNMDNYTNETSCSNTASIPQNIRIPEKNKDHIMDHVEYLDDFTYDEAHMTKICTITAPTQPIVPTPPTPPIVPTPPTPPTPPVQPVPPVQPQFGKNRQRSNKKREMFMRQSRIGESLADPVFAFAYNEHRKRWGKNVKDYSKKFNYTVRRSTGPSGVTCGKSPSGTTRTLFMEDKYNKWSWEPEPWTQRELGETWLQEKLKIIRAIKSAFKKINIDAPRMGWEKWSEYLADDEKYLPSNYTDFSDEEKKYFKSQLLAQRLLITMLLSARKKDETLKSILDTIRAMGVFSLPKLLVLGQEKLIDILYSGGFQEQDSYNLIECARIHAVHGKIEDDGFWLLALPGVGYKMVAVVMYAAFNINWGIPVDSHVFAIARATGMCNDGDKSPEQVAITMQQWVPKNMWYDINMVLASLGQVIDRGGESAVAVFDQLFRTRNQHLKDWLVRVCTSPFYVSRPDSQIIEKYIKKNPLLATSIMCHLDEQLEVSVIKEKPIGKKNVKRKQTDDKVEVVAVGKPPSTQKKKRKHTYSV
jgi:endonuclease-3